MREHLAQHIEEEESEINITPMLDVVFIMLIFFIVTATFVKEAGIEVNRPDAATAVKQEKANILVAIGPNNDIWIDRRQVDIRSVRPNIERLHAENPQGSVVIQAHRRSSNKSSRSCGCHVTCRSCAVTRPDGAWPVCVLVAVRAVPCWSKRKERHHEQLPAPG